MKFGKIFIIVFSRTLPPVASFWCLYCQLWTYFKPCSIIFVVDFEHVIAGWVINILHLKILFFVFICTKRKFIRCFLVLPLFTCNGPSLLLRLFPCYFFHLFNPFSANFTKLSNTLKQFVGKLPTNCLSVFDHFVGLALKGLKFSGL